jgi:hypothetical protein
MTCVLPIVLCLRPPAPIPVPIALARCSSAGLVGATGTVRATFAGKRKMAATTTYYMVQDSGYSQAVYGVTTSPRDAVALWCARRARALALEQPVIAVLECAADGTQLRHTWVNLHELPADGTEAALGDARRRQRVYAALRSWRFARTHGRGASCDQHCPCPRRAAERSDTTADLKSQATAAIAAALTAAERGAAVPAAAPCRAST